MVRPEAHTFEVRGLPRDVVGIGTNVNPRVEQWDARGNPVAPYAPQVPQWNPVNPAIAELSWTGLQDALLITRGYGSTSISVRVRTCDGPFNCLWETTSLPMRVIPEPDSVRIVGGSPRSLQGIGATMELLGDIVLPGETIVGVPLFWTSFDPDIATIDESGIVSAISEGTARIEGRMGAAVDTRVLRVVR